jgi:hypothetical protein
MPRRSAAKPTYDHLDPRARVQTLPWAGQAPRLPTARSEPEIAFPLIVWRALQSKTPRIEERTEDRESAEAERINTAPDFGFGPKRLRGGDLIAALVYASDFLHGRNTVLPVAGECLDVVLASLPCRAALVHFLDEKRAEYVIACARGEGAADLVLERHDGSDDSFASAACDRRASLWSAPTAARPPGALRLEPLGPVRALMVAPLVHKQRVIGAIELIDPRDGTPFDGDDAAGVMFLATRFAAFVGRHGVVVDVPSLARAAFGARDLSA